MIHAVVFESAGPFAGEGSAGERVPADARLAGLTLLRRAVLMAWKAGAARVTVVAADDAGRARWAASEAALPVPVEVLRDGDVGLGVPEDAAVLLLAAPLWCREVLLGRLLARFRDTGGVVAAVRPEDGARGPAVVSGRALLRAARECGGLSASVRRLLRNEDAVVEEAGCEICRRLDGPEALAAADREMYRGLTSITDGYVDRVFNRRISAWFTRRIINLPVTPNHVTWFHFSLGLLAAWLIWTGHYWYGVAGAVCLQLSVALDCSDGEVARLKYQFSRFGSWLDVATDNVVTIALFAAVARAVHLRYGPALGLTLGLLSVTGVLMCVAVVYAMARLQERLRPGEASSLAVTNRLSSSDQAAAGRKPSLVDRVINEATSRDFSVLVVAFAVAGRMEWFAWLAAVGSHLFWVIFGAIQLRMLRVANAQSR